MENGAGVPNGTAAAPTETPMAPVAATAPTATPMAPVAATALVREQDRLMPIANVIRIMRRVVPAHAKISDDAKELIQECVSEFISFVTGEANERCHAEHRKTVTAEDVVWAMDRLGFDDYVLPINAFLQRMRQCEAGASAGAVARAPPRPPGNGVLVQMHRAVYAPAPTLQGYAVPMAPVLQATVVSPRPVRQCDVLCTERVAPRQYYGDGASGAGSSVRGGCGDEESSSNEAPVPPTGTALPDPQ